MDTGLYKKHGGHFLIVVSISRKYIHVISTQAGELQLHRTTEQRIIDDGFVPCSYPPLAEAIAKFTAHPGGVSEAASAALLELKERNMDIKAATTAELVAFYNKHSATPIKKFKDRVTAEARVQAVLDAMPAKKPKKETADKERAWSRTEVDVIVVKGKKESAAAHYQSVVKAFDEYGIPRSRVSKFRLGLKEAGANSIEYDDVEYRFKVA